MGKILKVLFIALVLNFSIFAQTEKFFNPVADSLFKSGVELFKLGLNSYVFQGDTSGLNYFSLAYSKFSSIIALGLNHRASASFLMASKSLCYLNRFNDAEKLLREFLSIFPESEYREDALYTLGLIYIKLRNFKEAILKLDEAVRKSRLNKERYIKIVSAIADSLEPRELEEVEKSSLSSDVRYIVVVKNSDKLVSAGKTENAKRYVVDRLRYFQGTEYYEKLKLKISYIERLMVRPELKIGVFLPKGDGLSKSILSGLEMGIDEHNLNSGVKVGLEVKYYTSRDIDQKLLEFKNSPNVVGIIGPIYSEDVELCARFADRVRVPIVSPTATSDGLTRLSNYIFQLNSDYRTRSKALAQFAIFSLGLRYFLVLAPNDERIRPFVDAFISEVENNSGEVIAVQYYNPDETDLRPYFRNLTAKVDSYKIPVKEVSQEGIGLFAPILNPDFVGIISSQVYYHDLNVKILGNDVWNSYTELYMNRRYTDGVIFTSGQYVDTESFDFKNFARLYKEKFGSEPDEFSIYGYDAVKLILKTIEKGKLTADEVYKELVNYKGEGIGRDIIFDGSRVNNSISILVFEDNIIKRISKWTLSK
jgi:ABC-type branched-subunit amino acid transport system substrate-binding protein